MVVLGRIRVPAFTSHVLALLCIGLRSSFYHFRCWLYLLMVASLWMMTALWMTTATISWVTVQISRGVQASFTISYEMSIYVILYVLRDVRTLFMYYFLGIRYILLYCFDKTLWDLLGACVRMIILLMKFMLSTSMFMNYLLVKIVFWKCIKCFYYPLRLNV